MPEWVNIVLTSSLTCGGGIFLLVAGEIITKLFIEPVHEQSRLIGEIADGLIFYGNVYCNPGTGSRERMDEASQVLRQKASLLSARTSAIRWYWLWQFFGFVPKREDVKEAHHHLIGLSNSVHEGEARLNYEREKKIMQQLRIDILPD